VIYSEIDQELFPRQSRPARQSRFHRIPSQDRKSELGHDVIESRALPERGTASARAPRLLFAMDEWIASELPTKKSARITGDAMGNPIPTETFPSTTPWFAWPGVFAPVSPGSRAGKTSVL
jgi:hypothetical protein